MLTSVIIPTKGHAIQAAEVVHDVFETTKGLDVECIVVAYSDEGNREILPQLESKYNVKLVWNNCRAIDAWNIGASLAKGEYIHASSDDFSYTDGWLHKTIDWVKDSVINDHFYARIPSNNKCWWAEIGVGHRLFFKDIMGGVLVVPHYNAIYVDIEISIRAIYSAVFCTVPGAFIGHDWNYPPRSMDSNMRDRMMLQMRLNQRFPNNYPAVIE